MVRRGARLDAHQARRELLEERQHVPPLQLPTHDHPAVRIHAMNLENRLGDIETNRRDHLHGWLLRIVATSTATTSLALTCRWRSRPQHHKPTFVRRSGWACPVHLAPPAAEKRVRPRDVIIEVDGRRLNRGEIRSAVGPK